MTDRITPVIVSSATNLFDAMADGRRYDTIAEAMKELRAGENIFVLCDQPAPPTNGEREEIPQDIILAYWEMVRSWCPKSNRDDDKDDALVLRITEYDELKERAFLSAPATPRVTREWIEDYVRGHWPSPGVDQCTLKPKGCADICEAMLRSARGGEATR